MTFSGVSKGKTGEKRAKAKCWNKSSLMIKSIYHTKSDFPKGLKNSEVILVYKKEDHTCQRFSKE